MLSKFTSTALFVLMTISLLGSSGCSYNAVWGGPEYGLATFPIPVSPFFQDRKEDKFWVKERYERVPILGPITAGGPPVCLDPPSDDEVIRAMPNNIEGGLPFLHEVQRNNVRIIKEPMCEYVDPPRFYPLIGPAQLHTVKLHDTAGRFRTPTPTKTPFKCSTSTIPTFTWWAT